MTDFKKRLLLFIIWPVLAPIIWALFGVLLTACWFFIWSKDSIITFKDEEED